MQEIIVESYPKTNEDRKNFPNFQKVLTVLFSSLSMLPPLSRTYFALIRYCVHISKIVQKITSLQISLRYVPLRNGTTTVSNIFTPQAVVCRCSSRQVFLKMPQFSQENICAGVRCTWFYITPPGDCCCFFRKFMQSLPLQLFPFFFKIKVNPFMHNVVKWLNTLLRCCLINITINTFYFQYIWVHFQAHIYLYRIFVIDFSFSVTISLPLII